MEKINIDQLPETNVDWYADGERANALVLNRPIKQIAGIYNTFADQFNAAITLNNGTASFTNAPNLSLDASKIVSGVIDAARLPSYVDDVLEFANLAGFPGTGESGKIYIALDSNNTYRWSGSGYIEISTGGMAYVRKTSNYTAVKNQRIIADTTGGTFTITLPATPGIGDTVVIADGGNWGTTSLTVNRNGSTIEGDAEDMTLNIGGVSAQFTYDGTTWQVYTQAGWSAAIAANSNLNPLGRMNPSTLNSNVILAAGYNAVSAGPITIAEGVEINLNDTSNWTII
jgi:hypothetical protein